MTLGRAWTMVALVFLFMVINFADKAVVGLASVPIIDELHLSHAQFGLLGSAFFLLFSVSGVTVGFLANRFSTKTIMGVMGVVWAAALLPMSMMSSFRRAAEQPRRSGRRRGAGLPGCGPCRVQMVWRCSVARCPRVLSPAARPSAPASSRR